MFEKGSGSFTQENPAAKQELPPERLKRAEEVCGYIRKAIVLLESDDVLKGYTTEVRAHEIERARNSLEELIQDIQQRANNASKRMRPSPLVAVDEHGDPLRATEEKETILGRLQKGPDGDLGMIGEWMHRNSSGAASRAILKAFEEKEA